MTSFTEATVQIELETGRILPKRDLNVTIETADESRTRTDIGRVEEDGRPIKPDEMESRSPLTYECVDVTITTDTKGSLGGDTYKTLRIYTE